MNDKLTKRQEEIVNSTVEHITDRFREGSSSERMKPDDSFRTLGADGLSFDNLKISAHIEHRLRQEFGDCKYDRDTGEFINPRSINDYDMYSYSDLQARRSRPANRDIDAGCGPVFILGAMAAFGFLVYDIMTTDLTWLAKLLNGVH